MGVRAVLSNAYYGERAAGLVCQPPSRASTILLPSHSDQSGLRSDSNATAPCNRQLWIQEFVLRDVWDVHLPAFAPDLN